MGDGVNFVSRAVFARKRGSSLVEMLIAIVVLAVVLISMMGMLVISRSAIYIKDDETAHALALRYMERIESEKFDDLVNNGPPEFEQADLKYKLTAELNKATDTIYSADVRVTVRWPGAVGGEKTLVLNRIISSLGYRNVGDVKTD